MKQLLNDIVKQMTEDLLEKSLNSSRSERPNFPAPPASELSVRSSLCNQDELIDQYKKLLTAVNTVPPTNPSSDEVSFHVLQLSTSTRGDFQRIRSAMIERRRRRSLSAVSNSRRSANVRPMECSASWSRRTTSRFVPLLNSFQMFHRIRRVLPARKALLGRQTSPSANVVHLKLIKTQENNADFSSLCLGHVRSLLRLEKNPRTIFER